MATGIQAVESMTRPEAISIIRNALSHVCDDEHCACSATARLGLLCRGLKSLSDAEFRRRFDWIARKRPGISREKLEELVNVYHVARQQVTGTTLCCDMETREHCGCGGWNDFDNRELELAVHRIMGNPVHIV